MAEFTDGKGRHWQVRIDLGVLKASDATSDLGVFEMLAMGKGLGPILALHRLLPLLYEACRPEAKERKIGFTEFEEGFTNASIIGGAIAALTVALEPFFPTEVKTLPDKKGDEEDPKDRPTKDGAGTTSTDSPPSQGG